MDDFHASFDQFTSTMLDIAKSVAAYRRTLLEEGVPDNDATVLAKDYQQSVWKLIRSIRDAKHIEGA